MFVGHSPGEDAVVLFLHRGLYARSMTAQLLTELILDGATTTLPIEQFSLDRFHTGKLHKTTRIV